MPDVSLNYFAILVCAFLSVPLSIVWYSPLLFGKKWSFHTGVELKDRATTAAYVGGFLISLFTIYVLAHFVDYTVSTHFSQGALTGLWIWLGFILTTHYLDTVHTRKSLKLLFIDMGYHLLFLILSGGILAIWQ